MVAAEDVVRVALLLHPRPHEVLGAHVEGGRGFLRTLRPGARAVSFHVAGKLPIAARRIHDHGLFEAEVAASDVDVTTLAPANVRVEEVANDGTRTLEHDPYFFSPSIGEIDLHLFAEGTHDELHRRMGGHLDTHEGVEGARFAVWAPHASAVRVVGDFTDWNAERTAMRRLGAGVWEIFLPGVAEGALYKFQIATRDGATIEKSDPFAGAMELRPGTASRLVRTHHAWNDHAWIQRRAKKSRDGVPMSIYELHLGSWRKKERVASPGEPPLLPEQRMRSLTYRELADELTTYVASLGFTHVELLPVMEHPYDGLWGYQVSGYFAPTSRLGTPDDFRYLVDRLHQAGIGVILDWVPAHFPKDVSALGRFDGTPLFEHGDPRRGEHHHWGTFIFDYEKAEVRNFLVASALSWIGDFHADGLRVDAVASMLYLDYSTGPDGDWLPNVHGGNENLDAVRFLRDLTTRVHTLHPGALVIAEESTTWPGVTKPVYAGGLGFDLKWNMGWMHDTLKYFALDPIFRAYHHGLLTFGIMYTYSERFLLPLSHDEVVHLKKSIYGKMGSASPNDKRAALRALYGYMWALPGKKLLFMGGEIGQKTEWNAEVSVPWETEREHAGIRAFVRDLNQLYRAEPALSMLDDDPRGFQWVDANDADQSVVSFIRFPRSKLRGRRTGKHVVFVGNFTPIQRTAYRIGVPRKCAYGEVLNSDAAAYGGKNVGNMGRVQASGPPSHGFEQSILLTLPPLSCLFLVPEDASEPTREEAAKEEVEALTPPKAAPRDA